MRFCVLFLLLAPSIGWARETVRVGVYENRPKVFLSESGEPAGIFIDILEVIAEKEEWSLEFVYGTWGEGLDRLEAGDIDLMPDVAFTHEREQIYAFHQESVLSDWFQVYTRRGSGIQSIVDLNGRRVSVLERSVQQDAFEKAVAGFSLDLDLVLLPDYKSAFDAVADGEVDAVIANRFYGTAHMKKGQLEETAIIFNPTRLYFAASKMAAPSILEAIDRNLSRMKSDSSSVYYTSLRRWTSEPVTVRLAPWLKGVGLVAGALLVLSVLWGLTLKHQVAMQTRKLEARNAENARLYKEVWRRAEELEKRVAERTEELSRAKEQAESADRLKSAFLATMSHELRTPLNSIIGFTGVMLKELAGPLDDEQRKQLEMVRKSSHHLLALINDVLDISKIEAGQLEMHNECFNLSASIEKVAAIVKPMADAKGLALHIEMNPEVGDLISDSRRVEQILLNLLNNAIKFTAQGEVVLKVEQDADEVRMVISDTGIGIKQEDLGRLFRPFRQIDTGLSRQHEGTGLGLAICRRLSELLGGYIHADSEWGKGSVFTVHLPVRPSEAA